MSRAVAAWNRFWFPAVPVRRLAVLRIGVCAFALIDIAATGYIVRLGHADRVFYAPLPMFKVIMGVTGHHAMDVIVLQAIQIVLIVALALAMIGFRTRLALFIAAPLYAWWWATYFGFAPAGAHGRLAVVIALIALVIGPSGKAYSLDAVIARSRRATPGKALPPAANETDRLAGWTLRVAAVYLASAYVLAAYAKLSTSGIGWPWGGSFDAALVEKKTMIGSFLFTYPWVDHMMAGSALLWEAVAFVTILPRTSFINRRLRDAWVAYGLTFVVISQFVLNINFIGWVVVYLAFYDTEKATARLRAVAERIGERVGPRISVLYDGGCTLCVRTATALDSLDWFGRLRLVNAAADGSQPEHFEADDGRRRFRGFRAYRRLARSVPALWPAVALAYVPGISWVSERVYNYVARRRGRVGSCAVPDAAGQPASQP
jgi:predicted DCC family thiol-disulfide oxidoreductase YuxK